MKKLTDQVFLAGECETITLNELRQQPGEVFKQVELGKTYVITRNGKAAAVLSKVPGTNLTIEVDRRGQISYSR